MKDEQGLLFGETDGGVDAAASRPGGDKVAAKPVVKAVAAPPAAPVPGAGHPPPPAGGEALGPGVGDGPLQRMVEGNFLQYASYVIRDRAIPDVEDGLKPVQRRILWSLHENDDGKFIKVANVVGHCMQYHPHGDASIGDALVSLVNRQYLIEGQGNFGNLYTGDPAAASRYIECRLTELARRELFHDGLTRFIPSYDGRHKEPVKLPCKLPLLLMLGADGIAVGLSTRILPHNFGELIQAQIAILQKKPFHLLPDFQQAGRMDVSEYEKGCGRVRVRAVMEPRGDRALVIREIPYGTTTDILIGSIEDAARKKKIAIQSIHDFTSEKVEIEIKLGGGQDPKKAIAALYAFTQCEVSFSVRPMVIRDNHPVEMNVDEILRYNTGRLMDLLKRELEAQRDKLLQEIHIRTLVQIFVENRIYKRIEKMERYEEVQKSVLDGVNVFRSKLRRDVTMDDVEYLLGIQIRRISQFDINRSKKEIGDLKAELSEVEKNLKSLVPYAVRYLKELLKNHGAAHPRRTRIESFTTIEMRDVAAKNLSVCYDREKGFVGTEVEGETLAEVSSYDRILLLFENGRYQMIPPPDRLYIGKDLQYGAKFDRDRPMVLVYTQHDMTYMKRFTFGGAIMNKEYWCTPGGEARLRFFSDQPVAELYVKYRPAKRLRILQQIFPVGDMELRSAKSRGLQMTSKPISSVGPSKPRNWDDADTSAPAGVLLES